jgi:hypothetical protein
MSSAAIVLLGLTLASVQDQPTAPTPAAGELAGTWTGSAKLRSAGTAPATCEYVGAAEPPAVTLRLAPDGDRVRGTLSLDLPAPSGSSCPPVRSQQEIEDVTVSGASVAFRDGLGHDWNLGLRTGVLQGLVDWKPGDAAPAAAVPIRLSGEVALKKAPAGAIASRKAPAGGSGSTARDVAVILGANVVGIGAFAAVNVLTNEKEQSEGQATCSPRACFYAGLSDACVCNIEVTAGGSCFTGATGAAAGAPCNASNQPCEAGLSCNNGICEDRGGRCPF